MSKSRNIVVLIAILIGLAVGCEGKVSSDRAPFSIVTATPSQQSGNTSPAFNATPTPEDYVISSIPHCQGLTDLRAPLKFDWPDIEVALSKLEEYNWGYYTCAMSQSDLATFLHENILKPPYLWREVNRSERLNGQVVFYYHPVSVTFMYIWTLPKPDTQTSYLVIARGDPGSPEAPGWECRQWSPSSNFVALLDTSVKDKLQ